MLWLVRHSVAIFATLFVSFARGDKDVFDSPDVSFSSATEHHGRMVVIVPVHDGDLGQAFASLARWPSACSPVTLTGMDLVLYKAEEDDDSSAEILAAIEDTAGRCFAKIKVVYGNLLPEV